MDIHPPASTARPAPSAWFTGTATQDPVFDAEPPSRVRAAFVWAGAGVPRDVTATTIRN